MLNIHGCFCKTTCFFVLVLPFGHQRRHLQELTDKKKRMHCWQCFVECPARFIIPQPCTVSGIADGVPHVALHVKVAMASDVKVYLWRPVPVTRFSTECDTAEAPCGVTL